MAKKTTVDIRLQVTGDGEVKAKLRGVGVQGDKALSEVARAGRKASKSLLLVDDAAGGLKSAFSGLGRRALAVAGPAGLAFLTKRAIDTASAIDIAAKSAGLSAERFQTLRFAATQSGVTALQFEDGIRRLQRRLGLFAQSGAGPGQKAFEQLGISAFDAAGNIRSTADVFDEAIAKLGAYKDAATQSAIASQLFGEDSGPKFVELISQGTEAIARAEQQLRDFGGVITQDVLDQARAAQDQFALLGLVIDTKTSAALLGLLPVLRRVGDAVADVLGFISIASQGFLPQQERSLERLRRDAESLRRDIEIQKRVLEGPAGLALNLVPGLPQFAENALAANERLLAQIKARVAFLTAPDAPGGDGGGTDTSPDLIAKRAEDRIAALQAEIDALARLQAARAQDAEAVRAATLENEIAAEIRRASADVNSDTAETIRKLVTQLFALRDADAAAAETARADAAARADIARQLEATLPPLERAIAAAERWRDQTLAALDETRAGYDELAAKVEEVFQRRVQAAYAQAEKDAEKGGEDIAGALDRLGDRVDDFGDQAARAMARFRDDTADALIDLVTDFDNFGRNLGRAVDSILRELARLELRRAFLDPLVGGLSGLIGGLFGGAATASTPQPNITGLKIHTGGVVGDSLLPRRAVPASAFAGAPHFAGGGVVGANEVPAILHQGEAVFTPAQLRALGPRSPTIVQVIDQRGAGAPAIRTRRRSDGRREIVELIVPAFEEAAELGLLDRTFARFGGRRQPAVA